MKMALIGVIKYRKILRSSKFHSPHKIFERSGKSETVLNLMFHCYLNVPAVPQLAVLFLSNWELFVIRTEFEMFAGTLRF